MGAKHQNRQRPVAHDLLDGSLPPDARHLEIHRHEVGVDPLELRQELVRGREDPDDLDAGVVLEELLQRRRVRPGVVADDDAARLGQLNALLSPTAGLRGAA